MHFEVRLDSHDEKARHASMLHSSRQAELDLLFELTGERLMNEFQVSFVDIEAAA